MAESAAGLDLLPGPKLASGRDADVFDLGDGRVLRRNKQRTKTSEYEADVMRYAREWGYPVPAVYEVSGPDMVLRRTKGSPDRCSRAATSSKRSRCRGTRKSRKWENSDRIRRKASRAIASSGACVLPQIQIKSSAETDNSRANSWVRGLWRLPSTPSYFTDPVT